MAQKNSFVIDMLIVFSKDYYGISQAIPHLFGIIICFVFGLTLSLNKPKNTTNPQGHVKLVNLVETSKECVIEIGSVMGSLPNWDRLRKLSARY